MVCVLRVSGQNLDTKNVRESMSLKPYRVDIKGEGRANNNCLHYDIVNSDNLSFPEMIDAIKNYVQLHKDDLLFLRKMPEIDGVEVDIAVFVEKDFFCKNLFLDSNTLKKFSEFGISVNISLYNSVKD